MENLTGSEIVLKALSDQGVEVVFGYPGGAVLPIYDSLFNNIWIIDDLIYEDSDTISGMVLEGTTNRLFLISGSNVIVANTLKNGGGNSAVNQNVLINGCIIALNESFISHYWQNTTQTYGVPNPSNPSLSFGDGRGITRMGISTQYDDRGSIILWGSIFQKHRGHVRRHTPDGYNLQVPGIGYSKAYHYDSNMFENVPFYFQNLLQNQKQLHFHYFQNN